MASASQELRMARIVLIGGVLALGLAGALWGYASLRRPADACGPDIAARDCALLQIGYDMGVQSMFGGILMAGLVLTAMGAVSYLAARRRLHAARGDAPSESADGSDA